LNQRGFSEGKNIFVPIEIPISFCDPNKMEREKFLLLNIPISIYWLKKKKRERERNGVS